MVIVIKNQNLQKQPDHKKYLKTWSSEQKLPDIVDYIKLILLCLVAVVDYDITIIIIIINIIIKIYITTIVSMIISLHIICEWNQG